jgi:hypothetical protein
VEDGNPLGALQQALEMAAVAEPLERKLRVEGQKTGRLSALDLPGQVREALVLGILTPDEAQLLRDYDHLVMQIIDVDDFAPHELGLGSAATFPRAITPTTDMAPVTDIAAITDVAPITEGDQACASSS